MGTEIKGRVTRSKSTTVPETKMFTKEEVEDLIQKTLAHFRSEMESLLNSKLKDVQDKQNKLEEKTESLEMDLALYKESSERDMNKMRETVDHLQQQCNALENKWKSVIKKTNENEQYSRRNHLRFWGIKLNPNEGAADAVVRVVNSRLIINGSDGTRLPLTSQHIEVAHTLRTPAYANPGNPPPIIVRFYSRNVRDRIIAARRQLKKTDVSISEDLTVQNQKLITELKKCPLVSNTWSWNGKVYYALKSNNKVRHQFHMFDDLPNE